MQFHVPIYNITLQVIRTLINKNIFILYVQIYMRNQ